MAKKPTPAAKTTKPSSSTGENYAFKPLKIGPLLKARAEELGYSIEYLATRRGTYHRSIYRDFKAKELPIDILMEWGEILQFDFLRLYQSNVKPLPNPLQAELDKYKGYAKDRDELFNELGIAKNRILKLDAQLEQALDLLERKGGR